MSEKRELEVLHIVWVDSEASNEWTPAGELFDELAEIHSVGILMNENHERYVLAVSYDFVTDSANGIMFIPKATVRDVDKLCTIKTTR